MKILLSILARVTLADDYYSYVNQVNYDYNSAYIENSEYTIYESLEDIENKKNKKKKQNQGMHDSERKIRLAFFFLTNAVSSSFF